MAAQIATADINRYAAFSWGEKESDYAQEAGGNGSGGNSTRGQRRAVGANARHGEAAMPSMPLFLRLTRR